MKLELSSSPASEGISPALIQAASPDAQPAAGSRVEPCEFERLLQRAMEVLNARHLQAQLGTEQS